MQPVVHYSMHFVVPLFIALLIDKNNYLKIFAILLSTMIMDVDHLFANPIFMANRCSINFHFMHHLYWLPIYISLIFFKGNFRIIGIGLSFHILTDFVDCMFMYQHCNTCFVNHSLLPAFKLLFGVR
jgi:Family of unknown function (DUF6122)